MAGTSTERVRISGESGNLVAGVETKGIKNGLDVVILDDNGNQVTFSDETIITTDDGDGRMEYVGWAVSGSNTTDGRASSIWKIAKLTYTTAGNPIIGWADGVTTNSKIWNNRATYTYS